MLFSQAAKSLNVPDEREAELRATLDEIAEMTDLAWQDVEVGPLLWY